MCVTPQLLYLQSIELVQTWSGLDLLLLRLHQDEHLLRELIVLAKNGEPVPNVDELEPWQHKIIFLIEIALGLAHGKLLHRDAFAADALLPDGNISVNDR